MGQARDELIRQHGGTPWQEKKAATWLDDSGVELRTNDEVQGWLDDLAQRIREEGLPPLQLVLG